MDSGEPFLDQWLRSGSAIDNQEFFSHLLVKVDQDPRV